jgi:hypothetical protein
MEPAKEEKAYSDPHLAKQESSLLRISLLGAGRFSHCVSLPQSPVSSAAPSHSHGSQL